MAQPVRVTVAKFMGQAQSLGPTWWEELADSSKLSSDFHKYIVAHVCAGVFACTHITYTQKIKIINKTTL